MIITKITSGLGNQLFQYAIAKNLSIKNNRDLYFDLSYYKSTYETDTIRNFKLKNFNINYKVLNSSPLEYFSKATKLFPNRSCKPVFELVKEKHFHYDEEVIKAKSKFITLDGFWQTEKYFADCTEEIRNELVFKTQNSNQFKFFKKKILSSDTSVSMHIRRGDYVTHPEFSKSFGFIGLEYYKQAIAFFKQQFHQPKFFIFSDDKEWVKKNFQLGDELVFVENTGENSDLEDLQLMSLCNHNIIANSSYSWWGAWLNSRPDKLVISPKKWYKNKPDWDTKDLVPSSWIRL